MLTFVFTDIADSTALWQKYPRQMSSAQAAHDEILRAVFPRHGGWLVKYTGDGVLTAPEQAGRAAEAVVDPQRALGSHD